MSTLSNLLSGDRRSGFIGREWVRGGDAGHAPFLLVGRICLAVLFIVSGFEKFSAIRPFAALMAQDGVPLAPVMPYVAILIEFFGGLVLLAGYQTRLLAILFAIYTLATALIGHHFWTMTGQMARLNEINFYKNIGMIGGFLLLYLTGGGKYSLDGWLASRRGLFR